MDAQSATATLREHGKVSAGLRGFHHAKGVLLPGHQDVHGVVASDLQENAGVGPAFVGLSGGMKETRAKAEDGGDFFVVPYCWADGLQGLFMNLVHSDVAKHSTIISAADAGYV